MAQVKLQIFFKGKGGEEFKKVISYVNPDCDDEKLVEFVDELNKLTTNKVKDIHKIVENFLSNTENITAAEILEILNQTYQPKDLQNPITPEEITKILDGEHVPAPDADIFSEDDFKF